MLNYQSFQLLMPMNLIYDLTNSEKYEDFFTINNECFDEIYQYAADMGGAGYIFSGENDSSVMTNSSMVNLNTLNYFGVK